MQRLLLPFHTFQIQPKVWSCRLSCLFQAFVGQHWCVNSEHRSEIKKGWNKSSQAGGVSTQSRVFVAIPLRCTLN